ncbi:hypothetical protein [Pseudoxanthomonas koreensis]|uniref:hypothetical protein n=1 Tax=Pseudoxanthomonas koreensis TaxID=266061 RepID=UPI0035A5A288
MTDPHRLRFPRAATAVLLSSAMAVTGCAHSNAPRNNGTDGMTDASTPQALAPPTTAAEMGRRFLKLIGSIESRDEVTLERIRALTGISMAVKPGDLGAGFTSEPLGGGWFFGLTYYPGSLSSPTGISLHFQHEAERFADMSPVCELDFDYYNDALKAMGFDDTPIHGEIGELREWRYYKSDFVISVIPQNVVAGQAGRVCVQAIGTLN